MIFNLCLIFENTLFKSSLKLESREKVKMLSIFVVKGGTIKQMRKCISMKKFKEGSNIFCKMFDKRRIKFLNFMPIRGNFTIFQNFGPETFLFSGMFPSRAQRLRSNRQPPSHFTGENRQPPPLLEKTFGLNYREVSLILFFYIIMG